MFFFNKIQVPYSPLPFLENSNTSPMKNKWRKDERRKNICVKIIDMEAKVLPNVFGNIVAYPYLGRV
jgi:hypothetical protein